ncbi:helix-turn-helix domain-containing protein [Pontibacter qinzhouensis]|uniref:Helix-turn-helix domain-containing protein n=1 Tax=Pontibacter qinzhouensis TaxID=2603253 RepID=A0A5C8JJE1_9BACT|nr:helix-turn-helix domain-containing protein [Pontibacter qinzhouensis]
MRTRIRFLKKFKEDFGISPTDYILQERTKLAKAYLAAPGNSVTRVCYMAGFQKLH